MFECTQTVCRLAFDDVQIEKEALNRKKSPFLKLKYQNSLKAKHQLFDKGKTLECSGMLH